MEVKFTNAQTIRPSIKFLKIKLYLTIMKVFVSLQTYISDDEVSYKVNMVHA